MLGITSRKIRPLSMGVKGFTLIELMVVIAIIGVLASVSIPAYQSYVLKSRMTTVYQYTRTFTDKLLLQYLETGEIITMNYKRWRENRPDVTYYEGLPDDVRHMGTHPFTTGAGTYLVVIASIETGVVPGQVGNIQLKMSLNVDDPVLKPNCGVTNVTRGLDTSIFPEKCSIHYQ